MGAVKEERYIPGVEDFETVREYNKNSDWFRQHLDDELEDKYEGRIVLVLNQEVIFNSEDAEEARGKLRSLGGQMNSCYVRYVPRLGEMRMM